MSLPKPKATILLVEDSVGQREVLKGFLNKRNYSIIEAGSTSEALKKADHHSIELLLSDLRLGGPDGITLLEQLKEKNTGIQAIILSAYGTIDDATRAMKAGAYDFVAKPIELNRLETLIEKALEKVTLSKQVHELSQLVQGTDAFADVIGKSDLMNSIMSVASKAAASNASILILGESGTGKGVLARAIHRASPRKNHSMHTVSCAALPESLIEAELFGHEAGAFTGAASRKPGRFELAHKGTLFLDEVGEIPLHIQVKLLNVLQSKKYERIGGTQTLDSDVRIMAATNRNLEQQIQNGSFREDLYFRLNVVTLTLPPLRERAEDIPLLATHFIDKHASLQGVPVTGIETEALNYLCGYPFPGNIRELENWIERAIVLAEKELLQISDFPQKSIRESQFSLGGSTGLTTNSDDGLEAQVAFLETTLIKNALEANHYNQSAAARDLQISERAIRYKIKKYSI